MEVKDCRFCKYALAESAESKHDCGLQYLEDDYELYVRTNGNPEYAEDCCMFEYDGNFPKE